MGVLRNLVPQQVAGTHDKGAVEQVRARMLPDRPVSRTGAAPISAARRDASGKAYTAVLQWWKRALADRLNGGVIEAMRRAYPGALGGVAAP